MNKTELLCMIEQESKERLPVFPASVSDLLNAFADEDVCLADLAMVIENFPTIAMRLISLANSAWSSPVSPVTSLKLACGRLGFSVVRSVSIALAVAEPFNAAFCAPFNKQKFWATSLIRADAASLIAERCCTSDMRDTARTTALLSNLGLLWLADYMPNETAAALEMVGRGEVSSVNQATAVCCGFGYDVAGAAIASYWKLPDLLVSAIQDQYEVGGQQRFDTLSTIVQSAVRLVHSVALDQETLDPEEPGNAWLRQQWRGVDEIYEQLRRSSAETTELASALFGD
jgi:HD-like signal output (HDOD) protein